MLWEQKGAKELYSALQDSVRRQVPPRQEKPAPLSPNSEIPSMPENSQRWIALLGRCDRPTDDVADYRTHLGAALRLRGYEVEIVRVPCQERGWGAALADLRRAAEC